MSILSKIFGRKEAGQVRIGGMEDFMTLIRVYYQASMAARQEAARLSSSSVGPEHLLLGMLRMKDGAANSVFRRLHLSAPSIKQSLEQKLRSDAGKSLPYGGRGVGPSSDLVLNEGASNILKLAVLEARIQHRQPVEEEHLLLAILHDQVNNGAKQILETNNMNYDNLLTLLKGGDEENSQSESLPFGGRTKGVSPQDGLNLPDEDEEDEDEGTTTNTTEKKGEGKKEKSKTPVLDNFSTDLTRAAAEGKLDTVVGREREIHRVMEILGRRKKNNPILIGEPGVGKSAIVEGLAQLIAQRKCSPMFFGKRIVASGGRSVFILDMRFRQRKRIDHFQANPTAEYHM